MSGDPNPRTNKGISEEAAKALADDIAQLSPHAREHLELIMAGGKARTPTLRDKLNEEKVYPPFILDEITGTMFYQSKYLGSSFEGMIIVCSGRLQLIDDLTSSLTVVKSVSVQEPPSEAQNDLQERVRISGLVRYHPNILEVERTLNFENRFFVIFKNVSCDERKYHMVSLRSVMENHYHMGMPLTLIVVCLREALRGLSEIHRAGQVHKEISAGQIFLGRGNDVKLAFSATICDYDADESESQTAAAAAGSSSSSSSSSFPMSKVCKWASAPEIYQNEAAAAAYDRKSDIWLIGIVAFELAYGPGGFARDRAHLENILEDIHREEKLPQRPQRLKKKEKAVTKALKRLMRPPSCVANPDPQARTEKEVWNDFQAMVMMCLQRDANSRPSVEELLNFKVFVDEEKDAAHVFQCLTDIGAARAT